MGYHSNSADKEQTLLFRAMIDDLQSWGHSWTSIYRGARFDRIVKIHADRPVQVLVDAYKRKPTEKMVRSIERFHQKEMRKRMNSKIEQLRKYLEHNPGANKSKILKDLSGVGLRTIDEAEKSGVIVGKRLEHRRGRPTAYYLATERPKMATETAPMDSVGVPPKVQKNGAQNANKSGSGAFAADVQLNNDRLKVVRDHLMSAKELLQAEANLGEYPHIPPFLHDHYCSQLTNFLGLIEEIHKELGG